MFMVKLWHVSFGRSPALFADISFNRSPTHLHWSPLQLFTALRRKHSLGVHCHIQQQKLPSSLAAPLWSLPLATSSAFFWSPHPGPHPTTVFGDFCQPSRLSVSPLTTFLQSSDHFLAAIQQNFSILHTKSCSAKIPFLLHLEFEEWCSNILYYLVFL
jgi:hypothetical protein